MKRSVSYASQSSQNKRRRKSESDKKYKVRNARKLVVGPPISTVGFPQTMAIKHRYCESLLSLSCTSGAQNTYKFSANGMYDPNISATGHQPAYFDTMTGIYNHFHVLGSKCTIKAVATSGTIPLQAVLYLSDNVSPLSSMDAMMEDSTAKTKILAGSGNSTPGTLSTTFSAKKFFNGDILDNDELGGSSSANPTEQMFYMFSLQPIDLTSSTVAYFEVEIEYYAVWSERKQQETD